MANPAARFFPPAIRCVISGNAANAAALLAAEVPFTTGMAPQRREQFAHGRSCARQALAALGAPAGALPVGDQRAPAWPAGITGSISHADRWAAAAVGWRAQFLSIGLDLEERGPLDSDVITLICQADELRAAQAQVERELAPRLLFSAKESVFKCLWPLLRSFVDFHDVTVTVDAPTGSWQASVAHGGEDLRPLLARIRGGYEVGEDFLLTGAWISEP